MLGLREEVDLLDVWFASNLLHTDHDQWDSGKPIYNSQGLRQWAPLSPMIFILCMEPLQRLFKLFAARGMLAPLACSGIHQRVSMFADDVMVFSKPSELESRVCRAILDLFGHASGLSVNMTKSVAMATGALMRRWTQYVPCRVA